MKYSVELTELATQDIINIYQFLLSIDISIDVIETQLSHLESSIYSLDALPKRYPFSHIKKLRSLGVRKMVVGIL